MSSAALTLEHVARRFGDVEALVDASIFVRAGTVHALLGENGAGKTTLMRVAYGLVKPDRGNIRVNDLEIAIGSPRDAIRAGIGMVHQHFTIVPAMTVAENVALGERGAFDRRRAAARVDQVAGDAGLSLDPDAFARDLPVGAQQRLEIVKALAGDARVLILDEPTAVLSPPDAEELLRWVRAFALSGRAAVLITHKLREAMSIADDVTVIRRGRTVLSVPAKRLDESDLVQAMVGDSASTTALPPDLRHSSGALPPRHESGAVVVDARSISMRDARGTVRIRDASFTIRQSEIVGVVAVEGSGQRELLRALAGRVAPTVGSLGLPSRIGYVPEDRHHDALALDLSVVDNVALRGAGSRRGWMNWTAIRERAAALIATSDVRVSSIDAPARSLSGGNQQKLVFARELDGDPALLVVENPTRGLDIRAAVAVHERMREARGRGVAVVVHSSDLDEVLTLADRVFVIFAGHVREVTREREAVGRAMLGLW